ncbi:MAG TPA: glycosyltransferase [Enhygromyxa sp.]|nr:glycosyltransferase [Enhygromyxa sp.]
MSRITVLSVAYPLAPVGRDAVGGAEQILAAIDRALVRAGHRSIVIACAGSRCDGRLLCLPRVTGPLDQAARTTAQQRTRAAIEQVLGRQQIDLVHLHGHDFEGYLPGPGPVVLATLHLPAEWYSLRAFAPTRPRTHLSCVSHSQRRGCPPTAKLAVIENGVDLERLRPRSRRGRYLLALGRVCPEKAFHRALDAARLAGAPMLLAGEVFAYAEHRRYFDEQVRPRLDGQRRFIGPVGLRRKRALLAGARCLLVPSEVPETSSLVAMEALACGTPVISFGAGALAEIVEHGRTGFAVADELAMAEAIGRIEEIGRAACRRAAERRFDQRRMLAGYLALYQRLLSTEVESVAARA